MTMKQMNKFMDWFLLMNNIPIEELKKIQPLLTMSYKETLVISRNSRNEPSYDGMFYELCDALLNAAYNGDMVLNRDNLLFMFSHNFKTNRFDFSWDEHDEAYRLQFKMKLLNIVQGMIKT